MSTHPQTHTHGAELWMMTEMHLAVCKRRLPCSQTGGLLAIFSHRHTRIQTDRHTQTHTDTHTCKSFCELSIISSLVAVLFNDRSSFTDSRTGFKITDLSVKTKDQGHLPKCTAGTTSQKGWVWVKLSENMFDSRGFTVMLWQGPLRLFPRTAALCCVWLGTGNRTWVSVQFYWSSPAYGFKPV